MALGFYKYKFMVKFWQTPDKIPSLWHTSGKVIHKIKVCGNVLASFLKFDTFWQCYGNLPLVAKLFAITLPLAAKIGTVLWHRIPLPQSCCNLVATLRQRIFFIRVTIVTALWSLSKTHLSLLSTGSTKEDPFLLN